MGNVTVKCRNTIVEYNRWHSPFSLKAMEKVLYLKLMWCMHINSPSAENTIFQHLSKSNQKKCGLMKGITISFNFVICQLNLKKDILTKSQRNGSVYLNSE